MVEETVEGILFGAEVGGAVRDHGQDGEGWGGGEAEDEADEGTYEPQVLLRFRVETRT